MAVAGNTPTASFLTKIGKMQSAGCRLCRIARGARGASTDGLAAETHGHINSAGCEGMATTVTAAHHFIWRHLYDSIHAARKPKIKLKFVTLMSTLTVVTRRVSKNLQHGRSGGEGTGLCPCSSRCKEVRGQPQRDQGRTLGTMRMCEEIEKGKHSCRASKLGPVEQWWTQEGSGNHNPRLPLRVWKTDTFIVFHLFVLHVVTCLKTCHFPACFTIL